MRDRSKRSLVTAGIFLGLFGMLTAAVLLVDVQPVGPEGSTVGLAALNQFIREYVGVNLIWYEITDWLGAVALLVAAGFAALGAVQLIRRRSLLKVDPQILLLGVFYGLVAAVYLLFEYAIVNYRPVILEGSLEASYPSSHTMIVVCIMTTAMIEFRRIFPHKKALRVILNGISVGIMAITVIGRLISGVHWFTDIVAGILLAAALVMLYDGVVQWLCQRFWKHFSD